MTIVKLESVFFDTDKGKDFLQGVPEETVA